MANKEFTKFELARMKRTAQNVDGFLKQKNKLEAKKAEIDAQLKEVMEQIELTDAPTVAMTGYHTEDIIKKVVTPTDQVTKDGTVIKKTTFEFIYPDTIVPPAKEITEDEEEATDSTYYSEAEEGTTEVEIKGETVE